MSAGSAAASAKSSGAVKSVKDLIPFWAISYGFTAVCTALLIKLLIRGYNVKNFSGILMMQSVLSIMLLYYARDKTKIA